jgi:disulfide bond formation protein DsbB
MNASERSTHPAWSLLFASWLVATVSTLGALFFSDVMEVPICVLCWYQRIFMFPLVILLGIALYRFDRAVVRYALPLSVLGWLFAFFHVLLAAGHIPQTLQPCTQGVPCSENYISWFGFVTIPLLSLVAFSAIVALLAATHYKGSR